MNQLSYNEEGGLRKLNTHRAYGGQEMLECYRATYLVRFCEWIAVRGPKGLAKREKHC